MFKVAIVDNDTNNRKTILKHLIKYGFNDNSTFEYKSADACRNLGDKYNLYFLNTDMPGTKGMQYVEELRRENCFVIILSENEKYLYDAFDVHVIGFILTTHLEEGLNRCLSKLENILNREKKLSITCNNSTTFLYISDIVYIQSSMGDLVFYLKDGKQEISLNHTLTSIENHLNEDFLYCNRSILVNMKHVVSINQDQLSFQNFEDITMSRRKVKQIQETFEKQKKEERIL